VLDDCRIGGVCYEGKFVLGKKIKAELQVENALYVSPNVEIKASQITPTTILVFGATTTEIDLTAISPLDGWAWGIGAGSGNFANEEIGPGWIKFSYRTEPMNSNDYSNNNYKKPNNLQTYGVYLNRNTGEFMGYAWSGIPCEYNENTACGYGWLSFNKEDLIGKTPAQIDFEQNGQINGYAKFLSLGREGSSFDGYVDLRGLRYDETKGRIVGTTATTSGVGKIYFCDERNLDSPSFCVYVSSTTYPSIPNLYQPQIKQLRADCGLGEGQCAITVDWYNPQDFDEVEIKVFNDTDKSKNECDNKSDITGCWKTYKLDPALGQKGDRHYAIQGLSHSTKYSVIVRGIIKRSN
jgi:hypothetical protein